MIKRLSSFEQNFSVTRAAVIIGVLGLVSRLVGLARDRLFASRFGAGDTLDVYYAAFRVPDFLFNLLVLGTLSVAFIPVFTEWFLKDKNRAYRIASTVLNVSMAAISVVCLALLVFSAPLVSALFPKFSPEKLSQTLLLTRIFLVSPIIFTASNIFSSILNAQKRFLMASIAPILYNVGIIFGLLYLYPLFGLKGLGIGVIIGALLHLVTQIFEAVRLGFSWQNAWDVHDGAVRKIGKLFLPRIFGLDTSQISLLIGSVIGGLLASGTIAVLNLANNLQAVPIGIFAISIAMAAFPLLSEQFAEKDHEGFTKTLGSTMCQILFFVVPISIFMLLFRAYIVRLVYGAGKFNWENTIATFNTLGVFSISLFAQGLLPLFSRAFYARQNTKTPVLVGLASLAINIATSYFLATNSFVFDVNILNFDFTVRTGGVEGIAMGFTIASVINFLLLFFMLRRSLGRDLAGKEEVLERFDGVVTATSGKIVFSSLIMGLVGIVALRIFALLVDTRTVVGLLVQSGLAAILAGLAFLACASALGLPQVKTIGVYVKRIFRLS